MAWYNGGAWNSLRRDVALKNIIYDITYGIYERWNMIKGDFYPAMSHQYRKGDGSYNDFTVAPTLDMWGSTPVNILGTIYYRLRFALDGMIDKPGAIDGTLPEYRCLWLATSGADTYWTTLDQVIAALGLPAINEYDGTDIDAIEIVGHLETMRLVLNALYSVRFGIALTSDDGLGDVFASTENGTTDTLLFGSDSDTDPLGVDLDAIHDAAWADLIAQSPIADADTQWKFYRNGRFLYDFPPFGSGIKRYADVIFETIHNHGIEASFKHVPESIALSNFTGIGFWIIYEATLELGSGSVEPFNPSVKMRLGFYNGATFDMHESASYAIENSAGTLSHTFGDDVLPVHTGENLIFAVNMTADTFAGPRPSTPATVWESDYSFQYIETKRVYTKFISDPELDEDDEIIATIDGNMSSLLVKID